MTDMALFETLKLLFNITQFYPHRAQAFKKSISNILKILRQIKLPTPPLQPPINFLINSLINLELENTDTESTTNPLFPDSDPNSIVDRLINILDAAVRNYDAENLEQQATPLVTLLRKIYTFAPEEIKKHIQSRLLPSEEERNLPLGSSETLPSRLLRLTTTTEAPTLRESISSMMYELSDKDAATFVRNVGYGFASGFFMTHKMPLIPEGAREAVGTKDGESTSAASSRSTLEVNPITGQRLDSEPVDTGPAMTQEEKEREAERLFVLFER